MSDAFDVLAALPDEVKAGLPPAVRSHLIENAPPAGTDAEFRAGWWMAQAAVALAELERSSIELGRVKRELAKRKGGRRG